MKKITHQINFKGAALLLLFLFSAPPLLAQQRSAVIDTVTHGFLPALGYNSDLGLIGGGLFSRYHYKSGLRPFYSYLDINAVASTKGLLSATFLYDKPYAFKTDTRMKSYGYLSRFLQNQFYGISNYSKIDTEAENYPDLYFFKSFSAGFEITFRRPLIKFAGDKQLDALALIIFDYETPFGNSDERVLMLQQPVGVDGGRTSGVGAGIIWEGRNNEFAPTKGFYLNSTAQVGQHWLGSSFNYFSVKTDARAFTSFFLLKEVTFANRIFWHHTLGTTPYWKLAELGGELSMRGYPENRFLDDNALYLNSEIRTWLWDFPESDFRLGGTIFIDAGRTFSNRTAMNSIINDLRYTYGFGGTASFFTNEFILRADVGFSEEGHGVYFTAGYMF